MRFACQATQKSPLLLLLLLLPLLLLHHHHYHHHPFPLRLSYFRSVLKHRRITCRHITALTAQAATTHLSRTLVMKMGDGFAATAEKKVNQKQRDSVKIIAIDEWSMIDD